MKILEREAQQNHDGFRHDPLTSKASIYPVTDIGVLERATLDRGDIDLPTELALHKNAETKARAISAHADQIILAADTTVVDGGDILGKPKDNVEAFAMLTRLRGHTHQVYTGVALLRLSDGLLLKELSVTDVPMRNYSDEEIHAYILTGDPLDKAGAYAIQHPRFKPVASMSGCYAGVMGLPLCHVIRMMRKMEAPPHADAPVKCQTLLEYHCPVSRAILSGTL